MFRKLLTIWNKGVTGRKRKSGKFLLLTSLVGLLLFPAARCEADIAFINKAGAVNDASGTTLASPARNHTTGNFLVVLVKYEGASTTVSISDTAGNTYTGLTQYSHTNGDLHARIFYAKNINGNANNVVTATWTAGRTYRRIAVQQYSGVAVNSPFDQENTGQGNSGTAMSTGNVTTTAANELLVAIAGEYGPQANYTPGTDWTERFDYPVDFGVGGTATEDRIVTSTGTYNATMTQASSAEWLMAMAAFKASNASNGQTRFYLHAEPSEENSTYNSMLPSVAPEGNAQDLGTDDSNQNWGGTPPCEAAGFTYPDNTAMVNEETDSAERCVATFFSPVVGGTMQFDNTDTNTIDYSLWATEEGNCTTCVLRARLYEYVESGGTFNLIDTSDSAAVTAAALTNITWSSTPDTTTTVNPGNRLVLVVTMYTGTGEDTSGTNPDTINVNFDRLTAAPAYLNLDYTLVTADKPNLNSSMDDDFAASAACGGTCDGGALGLWIMETSGNSAAESFSIHDGGGAGSSGWLGFEDVKTADLAPTTLANYTYIYQTVLSGDGEISTQVSTSHATYPTTDPRDLAGLLLRFSSNTNFLILQTYYDGANNVVEVNDTGVLTGTTATITGNANNILLKWIKSGTNYQAQYCASDTTDCTVAGNWTNLGGAVSKAGVTLDRIGLTSFVEWVTGTNTRYSASFEWFDSTFQRSFVWDGGGANANWNTAQNWTNDTAPGSSNIAVFDGPTCSSNCSATVNVDPNVSGIYIKSSYAGTITQSSGIAITVGADGFVQQGGTFSGSNANINIPYPGNLLLSGGSFTSTSGTLTIGGGEITITPDVLFNHNNGVLYSDFDQITVTTGTAAFNDVTLENGGVVVTSGTMEIDGTLRIISTTAIYSGPVAVAGNVITSDTPAGYDGGDGAIVFDGSGNQTFRATGTGGAVTGVLIDKPGGTLTLEGTIYMTGGGSWTYDQGTVNAGTSTVVFNGGDMNIDSQGMSFKNVVIDQGGNGVNLDSNMDVDGNLSLLGNLSALTGGQDMTVGGNFESTLNLSFFGATNFILVGSADQTIDAGGADMPDGDFTINKTSGDARLISGLTLPDGENLTVQEGTFNINGQTLNVNPGVFTVQDGGVLKLHGAETATVPVLETGSTVAFVGDGDAAVDAYTVTALTTDYYNLRIASIDGVTDSFNAAADFSVNGSLLVEAGVLDLSGYNAMVAGNVDLDATLDAANGAGGNVSIYASGSWDMTGGTFTNTSSTVVFSGMSAETITSNTRTFNNVKIDDGLVGYWKFDDTTSPAVDSSGYGANGTWNNITASASVPAAIQFTDPRSASFNGTTSYIRMPNNSAINIAGRNLTVAFWVNAVNNGSGGSDQVLVTKPYFNIGAFADPYYQYGVEFDDNGGNTFDFYFASSAGVLQGPFSVTPTLGQWNHVAFTYNGSYVRGYLNGVNTLTTAETDQLVARGFDLIIGMDGALSQEFNGTMDDLRIYNRALSTDEIQLLAGGNIGLGKYTLQDNLDVDGTLTINGSLDVSVSNRQINVAGNWQNSGGVFNERSGTVVFDGVDQAILTSETFYNFSKTDTSNDSTDRILTFQASSTVTITNDLTMNGLDVNDRVTLVSSSPGTRWDIAVGAAENVNYLDVSDSEVVGGFDITGTNSLDTSNNDSGEGSPMWIFDVAGSIDITGTSDLPGGTTIRVAATGSYQNMPTTTTNADGSWTISDVPGIGVDEVLHIWPDGIADAVERTTVTKYDGTGNVTGIILNSNELVIGSDDNAVVTLSDLAEFDNDDDEDIMFTINGSLLIVDADNVYTDERLRILGNNALVVVGGETVNGRDVTIEGTLTTTGTAAINVTNGDWANTGLFNPSNSTVTFISTTAQGSTISGTTTFYDISIYGSQTTVMTTGTLISEENLIVASGTLDMNDNDLSVNGTMIISGGQLRTGTAVMTFGDAGADVVLISAGTLLIESNNVDGGDIVVNAATWNNTGGTVEFTSNSSSTTFSALEPYYNVLLNNASGTFTANNDIDVNGYFTLNAGTFNQNARDLNVAGDFTLASATTFTKAGTTGTLTFDGDLYFADHTSAKQDLGRLVIGQSPDTTTLTTDMVATSLTIISTDVLVTDGYEITLSGTMDINGQLNAANGADGRTTIKLIGPWDMTGGTFTNTNSTVMFIGTSNALTITSDTKSFNNVIINDGLIGYWKLDENNDNDRAMDSSGYANHGTASGFGAGGGPSATVSDMINFVNPRSLEFDGANDIVNAGNDSELQNVNTFTYCAWVYPQTLGESNDGRVVHKGTATARKQLQSENSIANSFGLLVDRATTDAQAISVTNTITLNEWQHVCGTYNESDGPRIYKNGSQVTYNSRAVGSGGTVSDTGDNFYIGNRADLARTWDGYIDEVRIYNRILSASEIRTLADGNMPGTGLGTYTLQDNLDVNGTLTLNAGELHTGSNRDINVGRSWMNHGGIFTATSGDVFFDGASSAALILSGSQTFYNVDITGSGVWTLQDNARVSSVFDVSAGTLTYSTNTVIEPVNIVGNATITGGTFTGQSTRFRHDGNITISSGTYTAPTDVLEITGSFAHTGGTFTNSGSTVMFAGTDSHTINTTAGTTFQDVIINDGLLGYWKLDETAESTNSACSSAATFDDACDSSGYGQHGEWAITPVVSTSVPDSNFHNPASLDIDDASLEYVDITDTERFDLDVAGKYTWSVWINSDDLTAGGGWPTLWSQTTGSLNFFYFYAQTLGAGSGTTGGSITNGIAVWWSNTSGSIVTEAESVVTTGAWYHVAVTYDGSLAQASRIKIYVNGQNVTGGTVSAGAIASLTPTDIRIGSNEPFPSDNYDGKIDEMRFYNRLLSTAEIQTLVNGNMPGTGLGTYTLQTNLNVDGTLRLNTGTLDVSASNRQVNVGGDWENFGGVFNAQTGTVVLDGTDQQIPASETFYNLSKNLTASPSRTLTFGRQSTVTISNTLTLHGYDSSAKINLRSSSVGTRFNVDVTAGPQTTSYVDVQDSEALSNNIRANNSADSGNTDRQEAEPHWIIGPLRGAVMLVD